MMSHVSRAMVRGRRRKLINEIKVWEMGLGLIRETRKQRQEEERKREIIEEWSCRDKAKRRA